MKTYTKSWLALAVLALAVLTMFVRISRPARAAGPWYVANSSVASRSILGDVASLNTMASSGSTIYVDASNNSGIEDGTQEHPFNTIQEGLGVANSGDIVQVAAGTYYEKVTLKSGVQLVGAGAEVTRIDGVGQNDSVVTASNIVSGTLLDGFTITHGTGKWVGGYTYGGGLHVLNSTLVLRNCIVTDNGASDGAGGIQVRVSTISIHNCTFSKNSGWWGGAITLTGTNAEIVGSIIDQSSAGYGGAILIAESSKATIVNNLIMHTSGVPAIGIDDTAGIGGSSIVTITNNTIVDNLGNGIAWNRYGDGGSATVKNNILWGNNDDLVNVTATYSNIEDGDPGEGNLSTYPLFVDPANNDYHLQRISLCIDAGTSGGAPQVDFEGDPRPIDGDGDGVEAVDIGADEFNPNPSVFSKTVNASMALPGTAVTYTIALSSSNVISISNFLVADALPTSLTYVNNSLTATRGSFGYASGVITWTGELSANEKINITFGAIVNPSVPLGTVITNTAVVSGAGKILPLMATFTVDGLVCNLAKYSGNPVLAPGPAGSWDSESVWHPTVIKDGSTYKMWYTGSDGSTWRIGYATSTDGITWAKYGGNPVLSPGLAWEGSQVYAPSVIFDNGAYRMWYTGRDSNGVSRIGYATSVNGVTWGKYGSNAILDVGAPGSWEDDDVNDPTVIRVGSLYHMWYTGDDRITARLGHATSANGFTWTKDLANPILDIGAPGAWDWIDVYGPSIVVYGGKYLLWYSGQTLPAAWQIGYAASFDGSAWTRQGMLIPEGAAGAFDTDSADFPSVLWDSMGFRVWYSGLDAAGTYTIGYATAGLCGVSAPAPGINTLYLPLVAKMPRTACSAYYTDNFGDPNSGWFVGDNDNWTFAYVDGEYQILVKNPNEEWSATSGAQATDFTASVTARRTSGDFGAYGIEFGINEDWNQFYQVLLDGQFFSIWRYNNGWTALQNWTASGYINAGTGSNRLKVIRNGADITVYVNNQYLATVSDSIFTGLRRIGLVAESDNAALDARFDDFSLYPVNCGPSVLGVGFEMGEPEIHEAPRPPDRFTTEPSSKTRFLLP